jgi:homoserine kinase
MISECLKDVIHQPFRSILIPGLKEVLDIKETGVLGVCLSGAGPTVLILSVGDGKPGEKVKEVFGRNGVESRVVEMKVSNGFTVE